MGKKVRIFDISSLAKSFWRELCRHEEKDPRKCVTEGKDVTSCAMNFFRQVKATCAAEFTQYATCLENSSQFMDLGKCRKTQGIFDKCMKDNMNIERPHYGYFSLVRVHDTKRPKPLTGDEIKPAYLAEGEAQGAVQPQKGLPEDFPTGGKREISNFTSKRSPFGIPSIQVKS